MNLDTGTIALSQWKFVVFDGVDADSFPVNRLSKTVCIAVYSLRLIHVPHKRLAMCTHPSRPRKRTNRFSEKPSPGAATFYF